MIGNYEKATCEYVDLIRDENLLYLAVKYLLENEHEIVRLTVPRIQLPVNLAVCPDLETTYVHDDWHGKYGTESRIRCGYGDALPIRKHNNVDYTVEIVEKKTHKLTVAEIEKRLGYKIEIVSEESNK